MSEPTTSGAATLQPRVEALPARHLMIRASAGAGKTYQLTSRYLALLAAGMPPETILATTFTRKAAGEILGRVLARLAEAVQDTEACEALSDEIGTALTQPDYRALLRRLVDALPRMAISTIDSFFHRLATCFRLELAMPAEAQLVDDGHPAAAGLRAEALQALLAEHAHELDVLVELLQDLHEGKAARSVVRALDGYIIELYDVYRQAPARAAWTRLQVPAGRLDEPAQARALEALRGMEAELPRTQKGAPRKYWKDAWSESVQRAEAEDWQGFLGTGIATRVLDETDTYDRAAITQAWQTAYEPLLAHARASVAAPMVESLVRRGQSMHDLLSRFNEHYTRLRQQNGMMLFSDLAHNLAGYLPQLGEDLAEVYYRLDGAVAHLLLDEFQDTSLQQWAVLAPFARAILGQLESAAGARSFFCVGDTKQAIYGWRGGCVELFDVVEAEMARHGGTTNSLSTSRRCAQVVLNAVNQVFENVASCKALEDAADVAQEWQERFVRHEAHHDRSGHVRLSTSPAAAGTDGEDDDEDARDAGGEEDLGPATTHEAFTAEQVEKLHRVAPRATIGVLVRTNQAGHRLLFELRSRGLPVSGEGGNPVTDAPAVAAVLSALLLADHPGHSAAAFHVASSPLGEVVGLQSTEANVGDVEAAALRIRRRLASEGYAAVLADWARRLAPACDRRNLMRLMQLVELAERHGPAAMLRPSQLVAFVEATKMEEPSPAPIRVMTIHASKGLEFDAVVLTDLDGQFRHHWPILVERETPTGPIVGVHRSGTKAMRKLLPVLAAAHQRQLALQRRETLCTLYVAMTRARHALHMIVRPRKLTAKGALGSAGKRLGAILRETLGAEDEHAGGGQVLYEQGDDRWTGSFAATGQGTGEPVATPVTDDMVCTVRLVANEGARRGWLPVSPSSLEDASKVAGADLLDLDAGDARQRGTLVHAWLEQVGFIDEADGMPDEPVLREVARRIVPAASDAWLSEQLAAFARMLARPSTHEALHRNGAAELWRERPFAVRDGDRLLNGQLDRVAIWRDSSGRATAADLIDFKTDHIDAATLDATVQRYTPQMQAYRHALTRLLRLEEQQVTARLLFLEPGVIASVRAAAGP